GATADLPTAASSNFETVMQSEKGPANTGPLRIYILRCKTAIVPHAGQYRRVFDAHGLQRLRFDVERLQDRRRDLRGQYRGFQHDARKARIGNDQPDIGVAETHSAVLGILLGRSRVDGAVDRLNDDIRRAAVVRRIVEFELQIIAAQDFIDEQCLGVRVQVVDDGLRFALVLKPNQRNVVVLHEAAWARGEGTGAGGALSPRFCAWVR